VRLHITSPFNNAGERRALSAKKEAD